MENNSYKLITKNDMKKVFWRSFALQGCFNYERMQNVGFAYQMIPVLKKLYPNEKDMAEALQRHLSYFNITPQIVTFVTGTVIGMEEKYAEDKEFDIEAVTSIKTALMGPLSGIGDSFFWGTFRVIAAGIGTSLAAEGSILGAILFLLIFNIPHYLVRWQGLFLGYVGGMNFIEKAQESGAIERLTGAARILGLTVVGAMIATMVSLTTPFVLSVGQTTVEFQTIFDELIPGILPFLLTMLIYMLMKKGMKTTTIMLGIIVIGIVGAFFGIL